MAGYVSLQDVTKTYQMGEITIKAADGISFDVEKGEFVIVVGPSGAGKTTVLNILGGMDTATSGKVLVDGAEISKYRGKKLIQYRREDIGFVFQFYNLMQNLTALENVELAMQICKHPLDASEVLAEVGLEERMNNFPAQLSGGEDGGWQEKVNQLRVYSGEKFTAVERADRRARLCDGKSDLKAAAGYLPGEGDDGHCHHSQLGADTDGGPRD